MGLARSILKKYNDLTFLRQADVFQLSTLTFTFICYVYHMSVYLEYQVLLILLFNMCFIASATYNLVSSYSQPEVQTLGNYSHATCQLYWLCFVVLFCLYLVLLSYYRAFGTLANNAFTALFVLYIIDLVVLIISWIVLWDLRRVTFSDCSERDESNYLEQFDPRLKNNLNRGDSERQLGLGRKNSNRKNYEISTDVKFVKTDKPTASPRVVMNRDKKVVTGFKESASDTDFRSHSKREMEYSAFYEANPELADTNQG